MKQRRGRVIELEKKEELKKSDDVSVYTRSLGVASKEKSFLYMGPKKL